MAVRRGVARMLIVLVVFAELFLAVAAWAAYVDWKDAEIEVEARTDLEAAVRGNKPTEAEWWVGLEDTPETAIAKSHRDQRYDRFWKVVITAVALPFVAAGLYFAVLWVWAGFRKDPAEQESL